MGLGHGTSIVRSGLVFHYDMENSAKSWKGKPTTNLTTDTVSQNGWSGSYTLINSATKTFDVQITQPNAATTSAWRSHYWDVSSHIGSTVTISMDVEIKSITDCDFSRTAVGQGNIGSFPFHIAGSDAADKMQLESLPGKTHFTWTGVINATGIVGISTWITNVQANGANVVLRISNVQIEVNGFETPFVNGTRSQSNALSDISGGANSIYLNSLVYPSDGTFSFNGSHFMDISNVPINVNSFTIEAFVKIPSTTNINKTIVGIGDGSTNGLWFFKHRSGLGNKLVFHGWDGVNPRIDVISADATPDNETFQAVVKYSDGTYTLYMNGEVNGTPVADNSLASSTTAYIGRHVSASYVEGNIFDVKIYNRGLSDAEVKQNFNATRGRYGI